MAKHTSQWNLSRCIEILFPPTDDEVLLKHADETLFHEGFLKCEEQFSYCLSYQQPEVRAAIHLTKYHHHRLAIRLLGATLARQIAAHFSNHVVIPIPLSKKRERERGYNQVLAVCLYAQTLCPSTTIDTSLLKRTRHTTPQSELSRNERLSNLSGAFTINSPQRLTEKPLLIVDDVATTGATFAAARAELSALTPTSITCLALAH